MDYTDDTSVNALIQEMHKPCPDIPEPTITSKDIDELMRWMEEQQKKQPQWLFVSLETYWSIKRARLDGVHHLPRRKIRKCFLRKRQARIYQGKRHLLRCQQQMAHREPEKFTL